MIHHLALHPNWRLLLAFPSKYRIKIIVEKPSNFNSIRCPIFGHFFIWTTEINADFWVYIEIETVYEIMVSRETERHVQLGWCHTTGSPFNELEHTFMFNKRQLRCLYVYLNWRYPFISGGKAKILHHSWFKT